MEKKWKIAIGVFVTISITITLVLLFVHISKSKKGPSFSSSQIYKMSDITLNNFFGAFTSSKFPGRFGTQGQIDYKKCITPSSNDSNPAVDCYKWTSGVILWCLANACYFNPQILTKYGATIDKVARGLFNESAYTQWPLQSKNDGYGTNYIDDFLWYAIACAAMQRLVKFAPSTFKQPDGATYIERAELIYTTTLVFGNTCTQLLNPKNVVGSRDEYFDKSNQAILPIQFKFGGPLDQCGFVWTTSDWGNKDVITGKNSPFQCQRDDSEVILPCKWNENGSGDNEWPCAIANSPIVNPSTKKQTTCKGNKEGNQGKDPGRGPYQIGLNIWGFYPAIMIYTCGGSAKYLKYAKILYERIKDLTVFAGDTGPTTYLTGLFIGGCLLLHKATGDTKYVDSARNVWQKEGRNLVDSKGALRDSGETIRNVVPDFGAFKMVFMLCMADGAVWNTDILDSDFISTQVEAAKDHQIKFTYMCNPGQDDRLGDYPTSLALLEKFKDTLFYTNRWTSDTSGMNKTVNSCPIQDLSATCNYGTKENDCKNPCHPVLHSPSSGGNYAGCQKYIDICTCIDAVTQAAGLSTLVAYAAEQK